MTIRSIRAIAVFCGSNYGASEEFADGARALGRALAKAGITIVYGGTTRGLMGVVSDAALASGGNVHGVITESLHRRGHSHSGLTKHEIAPTLRSRKERMVELADAFIALPGGIGTIEISTGSASAIDIRGCRRECLDRPASQLCACRCA